MVRARFNRPYGTGLVSHCLQAVNDLPKIKASLRDEEDWIATFFKNYLDALHLGFIFQNTFAYSLR